MKKKRKILLSGLLMLCSVAWIGCGKKASEDEPHDELVIEPLVGIGSIRFGMSKDQIIEHFGQPDKIFEGQVTKLNYVPSRGLNFAVDAERGLQEIGCWSEGMLPSRVTTFTDTTKEGIGIGASEEEIVAAYGQPDRTSMDSRGIIQNLHYDKLRARFSLEEGKLISMVLEAPK
jgi:5-deoxy-D-glucuronate isomerase